MSDPSVVPNPGPTPAPRANPVVSAVPAASVPKPMDPIMGTYVESVPGAGDWHVLNAVESHFMIGLVLTHLHPNPRRLCSNLALFVQIISPRTT